MEKKIVESLAFIGFIFWGFFSRYLTCLNFCLRQILSLAMGICHARKAERQRAYKVTTYVLMPHLSITRTVGSHTHTHILVIDTMVLWCKSDHLANGYFDTKDHYVKCKINPTILVVIARISFYTSLRMTIAKSHGHFLWTRIKTSYKGRGGGDMFSLYLCSIASKQQTILNL